MLTMEQSRTSPAAEARPTLFIGLDGAEPGLIRKWIAEGLLPNLAKIYHTGLSGDVATLPGLGDGATWPTLITGVNPGRHGRYFRRQFEPGSYKGKLFSIETDMRHKPFWSALGQAGKRVAILDLPYSIISNDRNCLELANWLIHDRYADPISNPPGFAQETVQEFGDDPIAGNSDLRGRDAESLKKLTDDLLYRVGMKEKMVLKEMHKKQYDLLMTCFAEPHDIGHMCWHYHDPASPDYDPDWVAKHGDPLKKIYLRIDEAIGNITRCADQKTRIMVFAGLGMGPGYTANCALDQILARIEGCQPIRERNLWKRATKSGQSKVVTGMARMIDAYSRSYATSRRQFFATPHNENSGAVRINLKGREPFGKVPAHNFDTVCNKLTDKLLRIKNLHSGGPLVREVIKVRETYHGKRLPWLPDLMVCWERESPITEIGSPEIGKIAGIRSWGRTGDHSFAAMIMVAGDGIKSGQLQQSPSIVDISATIASLQGVTLTNVDGRAFGVM